MKRVIAGCICVDRRLKVNELETGAKHIVDGVVKTTIGGGASNNAVATRALAPNRRVLLFAHVGDDDAGAAARMTVGQENDIEMPLAPLPGVSTSESIIISESDFDGRGTIVGIPGARDHDLPLDHIEKALVDAEAFYLCAPFRNHQIGSLLSCAQAACVPAYFALGSAQVYDQSYAKLKSQLKSSAELVICNYHEARKLTGKQDVQDQLRALRFSGLARAAVVTCGENGLWGFDNLGICHEPAYQAAFRPVVNDTGAGDAAAAGVIDSLLRGMQLQEALACGARNGFEACTAIGLQNVCDRAQMDAYLAGGYRKAA